MSSLSSPTRRAPRAVFRRPRERGVVLFIALLVMVALSLAAIALIRSADTATIVAGNLAFKQSAAAAVDRSIEQAVQALFDPGSSTPPDIADTTVDDLGRNYFACVQADGGGCLASGNPIPEVPAVLITRTGLTALPSDAAGNTSYYVIERMCNSAGAPSISNCNMSAAGLGAAAGTQHYEALQVAGGAYFRVTVRVEGPRNTIQYAQAILR